MCVSTYHLCRTPNGENGTVKYCPFWSLCLEFCPCRVWSLTFCRNNLFLNLLPMLFVWLFRFLCLFVEYKIVVSSANIMQFWLFCRCCRKESNTGTHECTSQAIIWSSQNLLDFITRFWTCDSMNVGRALYQLPPT